MYQRKQTKDSFSKRRLLFFLGRRGPNGTFVDTTPGAKSLYVALIFGAFFAVMLFIQMMSVENVNGKYSSFYVDEEEVDDFKSNEGILGRFRLLGDKNKDETVLPPNVERILTDAKHGTDSSSYGNDILPPMSSGVSNSSTQFEGSMYAEDRWQTVSGAKDKFYVFSAFYDDRNIKTRYVRVIAATVTRKVEAVQCKLWYSSSYKPLVVKAVNKLIRENWNLKYSAYFVLCLIGNNPVPDAVSVMIRTGNTTTWTGSIASKPRTSNYLPVQNALKARKKFAENGSELAVCVKPLHYEYNKVIKLIEFVEFNRILGVKHFVFYNHTIGEGVNCLLRLYRDAGLVSVLPWQLNIASQKEIRTEGLFAALNDCLYRTMYAFEYVLMIDLDEYVVPRSDDTLLSLIARLSAVNNNDLKAGAYSFQNAFFYLQWPDDESVNGSRNGKYDLSTLRKTRRKEKLHIHKQRSKLIVLPRRVVEVGNHFVWEFVPHHSMVNVAPRVAFLHHYRICEYGGDECVKSPSVVDRRAHYWTNSLLNSVDFMYNEYTLKCN